jgi:hypothetical protein
MTTQVDATVAYDRWAEQHDTPKNRGKLAAALYDACNPTVKGYYEGMVQLDRVIPGTIGDELMAGLKKIVEDLTFRVELMADWCIIPSFETWASPPDPRDDPGRP